MGLSVSEKKNFGPGVLTGKETVVDGTLTEVKGTDYIYVDDQHRSFSFFSIQDEWRVNSSLQFNLGFRIDDYSDFGTTVNPRVGLLWKPNEKLKVRLFRGSAFRAPSIAEVGAKNNPASLGNPNLEPEKIVTYEAAIDYQWSKTLTTNITLFQYEAEELIDFVSDATTGSAIAQNTGELFGAGVDIEVQWRPSRAFALKANYSHLNSEDENKHDISDVANELANINLHWKITHNLEANLFAKRVMDRKRAIGDVRNKMKDYTWMSVRLNYKELVSNLDLAFVINNLLDDEAANPSSGAIPDDYPLAGRQWMLEMNYHF